MKRLLPAGLAALALFGCGGDDEAELTTPVPPAIETGVTGASGATGATGPTVKGSEIEDAVEDSVADPGFSIDCPEQVSVEEGSRFRCDLTAVSEAGTIEIEIEGGSISFHGATRSGSAEYTGKGVPLPEAEEGEEKLPSDQDGGDGG